MIRYFHGRECPQFSRESKAMFYLRARQFRDRLNWRVSVDQGCETDEFDRMNPLYLVSIDDDTGDVAGTLRFLPTTGPTMMKGVFDRYFDEPFDIETPLVWECTRFAIEPQIARNRRTPTGLCKTTFELMQGGCEVAMLAGVEQIVGIFDRLMVRIYRRAGWAPEIVASTDRLGSEMIFVGLWDVGPSSLHAMRQRSGMMESVLEAAPSVARAVA
jgi:N-acyl-L-homoserine lactone synthetase